MKVYVVYMGYSYDELDGPSIQVMEKAFIWYDAAEQFRKMIQEKEGLPYRIQELDLDWSET